MAETPVTYFCLLKYVSIELTAPHAVCLGSSGLCSGVFSMSCAESGDDARGGLGEDGNFAVLLVGCGR